jgi:hypothetical protein
VRLAIVEERHNVGRRYDVWGDDSVGVWVEESRVVSVYSSRDLIYHGVNLLSCSYETIVSYIGHPDEIGEQVMNQVPIEFDRVGLQLWVDRWYVPKSAMLTGVIDEVN